jgi:hypothetical protein
MNEVYVLLRRRPLETLKAFLTVFAPRRRPLADDYPVPEFVDVPASVFHTEDEILEFLTASPSESYSMYWAIEGEPRVALQVMMFFLSDGNSVLGVAVRDDGSDGASMMLKSLKEFAGSPDGYCAFDERPPETALEFRRRCK